MMKEIKTIDKAYHQREVERLATGELKRETETEKNS